MTSMTAEEWRGVQEALCVGGLEDYINTLLSARYPEPAPVMLSDENRRILLKAYDDGEGGGITLVAGEDPRWFVGMYEDFEICHGVEHEGVLYTIVDLSGGGLFSVVVGSALIDDDEGDTFHSFNEAKAYVQGCIAK